MKKSFNATIITPKEYKSCSKRFSVIYLLHGYSNDYSTWTRISPLNEYADSFHLIFVCPDGNFNSWYIDSPVKTASKFETYITKEVIAFIDSGYRTWASANGRAIIGSSMGGHGATTLLAKHPDLFCGAGSISGIMDLAEFPAEWDLTAVLGEYRKNSALWTDNSFYSLLEKLSGKNKAIILDCGTSDFALPGNRKTHEKLLALNIPHQYFERPGSHTPLYAQKVLGFHVKYFSGILLKPGR
jgi:S-formylglutathione hydrolase FrmB